ncbi:hypothetical protein Q8A73_006060 [Channa argus]|nr:hypothetical protein Q8A73_006060 [Channa argus]
MSALLCRMGFNGHTCFNTVNRYDPEKDQWLTMAQLYIQRCGVWSAVLNGKIYVRRGYNWFDSLCRAECYGPDTNLLTQNAPTRRRRSELGVAAYRDRIFAVSGWH